MRRRLAGALAGLGLAGAATGALAQMAVFDGANYGQLLQQVAQGARQLATLQTQVEQQAAMLAHVPGDVSGALLTGGMSAVDAVARAGGLGFKSGDPAAVLNATYGALTPDAAPADQTTWRTLSRQALADAMAAEDAVAASAPSTLEAVSEASAASRTASGPTSAAQTANQLLAGLSAEIVQLQSVVIAGQRSQETQEMERRAVALSARQESQRALQDFTGPSRLTLDGRL